MFKKNKSEIKENKKTHTRNGVVHISHLFKKYTHTLKAPQNSIVCAVIEVVKDMYGFTLNKDQIMYQTHTKIITLHIPGIFKSEILLHKNKILTQIGDILGNQNIPKDIL